MTRNEKRKRKMERRKHITKLIEWKESSKKMGCSKKSGKNRIQKRKTKVKKNTRAEIFRQSWRRDGQRKVTPHCILLNAVYII